MEYFLQKIADSLYREFGNELLYHCLVFPGRRAGIFFLKYLAGELEKPLFAPAVMTISDLFCKFSSLRLAENEILLFELFREYKRLSKTPETFDEFYFWGDMLLNDFDDTDKYLADAGRLFSNVQDIKNIDSQFGGLTPEQLQIVKRFWTNYDPANMTGEKSRFISLWSLLKDLYLSYRTLLVQKNIAYEGMIFREVAEKMNWKNLTGLGWNMVHFIGFNALNECEKTIMRGMKKEKLARFYWDYDNSYIHEEKLNSAGFFMRENLEIFGNDMPEDWSYDTLLSKDNGRTTRRIIDASSDTAQVKLVPALLKGLSPLNPDEAHNTAIILADENLLVPILTSLPDGMIDVNITMGYPLGQTQIYYLVSYLLDLQQNTIIKNGQVLFSYRDVLKILRSSLVSELAGGSEREIINEIVRDNILMIPSGRFNGHALLSEIFSGPVGPETIAGYLKSIMLRIISLTGDDNYRPVTEILPEPVRNEFIYRVMLSINRLETVFNYSGVNISVRTWRKLLEGLLKKDAVPFSGEPLSGIQIMGILESRALDFRNLIILSANEGVLPSATASSSFIPYTLREAFGLPSINHSESVFAYHFYRLLHRAANVTFVYNSDSEGLRNGEMSRFLQQMKYEPDRKPEFMSLHFEIKNPGFIPDTVARTEEHNKRLPVFHLMRETGYCLLRQ